jgi:hypothetical protein
MENLFNQLRYFEEYAYNLRVILLIHPTSSNKSSNPINLSREMRSLFHWDSSNPSNPKNLNTAALHNIELAAYPSGKGADCNPAFPGSTPGAASISLIEYGKAHPSFAVPATEDK